MDYEDGLALDGPLIEGPELAAKVRDAIELQKNGPLPSWIKVPKRKEKPCPPQTESSALPSMKKMMRGTSSGK